MFPGKYHPEPRLSQDSGVPGLPILGVLLYLCTHPLTQNDQIRHGNTYEGGGMYAMFYVVSHAIAFAQMRRAVC